MPYRSGPGWDHPRSRGEYWGDNEPDSSLVGSSPLSRGILAQRHDLQRTRGIIPALAGNTIEPAGPVLPAGSVGSSPLSRGIPEIRRWFKMSTGIIPALAGNTRASSCRCCPRADHPRSRGEYYLWRSVAWNGGGSSPLSRGIQLPETPTIVPARIIPALAGNTRAWHAQLLDPGDHPRSRGEYRPPEVA